MTYHCWCEPGSPAEVVFIKFPLCHTFLSEEKSLCKPHTGRVAGHDPSHLGRNSYVNHLQLFCTDLFVLPPGFTYRYNSIYFIIWVTIHSSFILLLELSQLWLLGAISVSSFLGTLHVTPLLWSFVSTSLLSSTTRCSGLSFIPLPQL